MDERQLAELFRDAADGGPPARFGHTEVVAASRRATARHRMTMAGGTALGVAALVGGIVVGGGFLQDADRLGTDRAATAGGAEAPSVMEDQRHGTLSTMVVPPPPAVDQIVPEANAEQGRTASGKVVPWPGLRDGDARAGCGPMDRELVEVLRGEFPAIPAIGSPVAMPEQCPPGARAAGLPLQGAVLYVVLAPVRGDGPPDREVGRDDGATGYFVYTPKGDGLLVLSVPTPPALPTSAALASGQIQTVAERIAQRY